MKTKTLLDKILDVAEIVATLMSFILILCVFISIIKC